MFKKIIFYILFNYFFFSFHIYSYFKNDIETLGLKNNPIAIEEKIYSIIYNKDVEFKKDLISKTIKIFDSNGMIIQTINQKNNILTSTINIITYNENKQLTKIIEVFGKPINKNTTHFHYNDEKALIKKVKIDKNNNIIRIIDFNYQSGQLISKKINKNNNELAKIIFYSYFDNFQIKTIEEKMIRNNKLIPIYKTTYKYLLKEKNFLYNRTIKKFEIVNSKEKLIENYQESLLSKNSFFLKYTFDTNKNIVAKQQLDFDENKNITKISIYEQEFINNTKEIHYFFKNQSIDLKNLINEYYEKNKNLIGPKNITEAKDNIINL